MQIMKHSLPHSPVLPAALLAALMLALPASGQEIKRWVDQRGVVHYSDAPPPPNDPASSPVTTVAPVPPLTQADKARAAQDMEQYRQSLTPPPAAPASAAPASDPSNSPSLPQDNSCASQWARYNAAYACMDPYRMNRGGLRPEAFEKCPQVPQPQCSAPSP
jgi:hypothetical protein